MEAFLRFWLGEEVEVESLELSFEVELVGESFGVCSFWFGF